ncbi:hypothetical protein ZIOFF_054836 [Zingiber officinale]|uniref:P-type ATPase C-terminal domain-containing protein n=1 Tax=Zingiber officinale TaxID=94328 RepID=A0A8J5FV69_ZINOF|nr:hypothetical protein ZIOFF_054836 [Zingiber officinale]
MNGSAGCPMAFVVGLSMAKEALEDWNRLIQDMKVNSLRSVSIEEKDGLATNIGKSYDHGICYVETMNLDGETNLKVKRSWEVTLPLHGDVAFSDFTGTIRCEDPNPSLYTFVGNFEYGKKVYALDPSNVLLRGSKLRNTTLVYGVVIFTGDDSKVPQCIDTLAQAGLKIWVLTGDKMETAINIGFACSLLRQGMKQICLSVDSSKILSLDPKKVTRLVKEGTGKTTLAIGDGANDLGMIQEADIDVGISGVEGMQAVMASDFAISQFCFLERLLVIHGHWCYMRIAQMICYFYKNIAFGLTIFYFEAYTGVSGQSVFDDWYMLLFNVILRTVSNS